MVTVSPVVLLLLPVHLTSTLDLVLTPHTLQPNRLAYKFCKGTLTGAFFVVILVWNLTDVMANDPVNRPSHYTEGRKFETIEVIEDWGLGFCLGNTVKYISRAGRKLDHLEDLKKARWYLDREIALSASLSLPLN